jgi:DNA-directed RNA polymerase specialized sigma24 family protein
VTVWGQSFEAEATRLVERVVSGQTEAWRALLVRIAPIIEGWARGSRVLRCCRLSSEDDVRTVMVGVLERLADDDYANLRRFLSRTVVEAEPEDLIAEVVRLGRLDEDAEPERDDTVGTPFRAWLIRLVDFVARDHARERLGWVATPGEPTKRDLHTDAPRLDAAPEPAARPPMTDRLTVAKLVAEVREHIATFPSEMQVALGMWLDDVGLPEIAARLELADPSRARALIRAGQARLRERFRGRSPLLFA